MSLGCMAVRQIPLPFQRPVRNNRRQPIRLRAGPGPQRRQQRDGIAWGRAAAFLPPMQPKEEAVLAELRRYFSSEGGDPAENQEGIDIAASAAEVRAARVGGTLPLIVLSAGIADVLPTNLAPSLRQLLMTAFSTLKAALTFSAMRANSA